MRGRADTQSKNIMRGRADTPRGETTTSLKSILDLHVLKKRAYSL